MVCFLLNTWDPLFHTPCELILLLILLIIMKYCRKCGVFKKCLTVFSHTILHPVVSSPPWGGQTCEGVLKWVSHSVMLFAAGRTSGSFSSTTAPSSVLNSKTDEKQMSHWHVKEMLSCGKVRYGECFFYLSQTHYTRQWQLNADVFFFLLDSRVCYLYFSFQNLIHRFSTFNFLH